MVRHETFGGNTNSNRRRTILSFRSFDQLHDAASSYAARNLGVLASALRRT